MRGVASNVTTRRADFSVADNGTLAWRPGRAAEAQVTTFDRGGRSSLGPGISHGFSTPAMRLPSDVDWEGWEPGGRRLIGWRSGALVARDAAGGEVEELGTLAETVTKVFALSPDRTVTLGRVGGRVEWARVREMGEAHSWTPIVDVDESQVDASFSPDGGFVLYTTQPGGVYVQPFPGTGRRQRIDPKGVDPVWRGDGKEIVYVREDAVRSVVVSRSAVGLTLGEPQRLFGGLRLPPGYVAQSQTLAVSRDGSRIYFTQGVSQPASDVIHVMIER